MEVGGPGVHTLLAARLVEEALRQNLDSVTTLHPLMEDLIVKDHHLNPLSVTLKIVQWMEAGGPGAPILHAARPVVEVRRREPESVTTQPLLMAGRSVQEHPIRQKAATLRSVDQAAG